MDEVVGILGACVAELLDNSLQYHSTSLVKVSIPTWYMARKRFPSNSHQGRNALTLKKGFIQGIERGIHVHMSVQHGS